MIGVAAGVGEAVALGKGFGLAGNQVGKCHDFDVRLIEVAFGVGLGNPSRADDSHAEGMVIGPFFTPGGGKAGKHVVAHDRQTSSHTNGESGALPRMLDDAGIILVLERFVEIVFLKGL